MAALVAVTRLLKSGDELLIGDDVYGGMVRLVARVLTPLHGVKVTAVDTTDLRKVEAAITPATRMLHLESPTNPMMRISDIRALSSLMRSRGILVSVDSTMMSPMLQKPLELGADIGELMRRRFSYAFSMSNIRLTCPPDGSVLMSIL